MSPAPHIIFIPTYPINIVSLKMHSTVSRENENTLHRTDSNPLFRLPQKFSPKPPLPAIAWHSSTSFPSLPGLLPAIFFSPLRQTLFLPVNGGYRTTAFDWHPVNSASATVYRYSSADSTKPPDLLKYFCKTFRTHILLKV